MSPKTNATDIPNSAADVKVHVYTDWEKMEVAFTDTLTY